MKISHIIVLTALFVSLVGTLLVLNKLSTDAEPITGATASSVDYPKEEEGTQVIVTEETNQTETTDS